MSAPILKDPGTALQLPIGFAQTIMAIDAIDIAPDGLIPGAALPIIAAPVALGVVTLGVTGGADGERYTITVRVQLADGSIAEQSVLLAVIEADWTMRDATPAWLSVIEFIERYGLDETIVATAANRSGRIDRPYLVSALRDAQAEVQMNLAGRYTLPLSVVPDAIKGLVSDLAAVRLYFRRVPESVDAAARAARAMLKRIADGALPLPGVAGILPEAGGQAVDSFLVTAGDAEGLGDLSDFMGGLGR